MREPSNAALRVAFGQVLRERRTAAKLSQEALALEAGLSTTYVATLERGEYMPTLGVVVKLARVLGCSGWELVRESEALA